MKSINKKLGVVVLISLLATFLSSCQNYGPYANTNAVIGGAIGAATGALIGENKGRELEGAAIGGAIGAIAGGAVGNAQDQVTGRVPQSSGQTVVVRESAPTYYRGSYPYYGSYKPYSRGYYKPRYYSNSYRTYSRGYNGYGGYRRGGDCH